MDDSLDLITGSNILTQLAQKHYYAKVIVGIIPDVVHLINENELLHKTMRHILSQINTDTDISISWSQLDKNEKEVINNFFDYLYFTSEQFLKEAP